MADITKLPNCCFCGRPWLPPDNVNALKSFCSACEEVRRQKSSKINKAMAITHYGYGSYILSTKKFPHSRGEWVRYLKLK